MERYPFLVLPFAEIEIRLGTLMKNRFDSSVDRKYFEKIKETLESGIWVCVVNKNTVEYIQSDKNVNTKLVTDTTKNMSEVILKEKINSTDIQLKSSPFDIRYSISQEFKLNSSIFTFSKENCVIRNKTRKSFLSDHFQYDLTVVNENIDGVVKTKYEIEIELLINNTTLNWKPGYINDFLECKVYDLINIVEPINRDKFKLNLIS